MIFNIEEKGSLLVKVGDHKSSVRQRIYKAGIFINKDRISCENTDYEEIYDIIESEDLYAHISYNKNGNICFIDIDKPSIVSIDGKKNLFKEDYFKIYELISKLDSKLIIDNRGFISKKLMFGVHAPSFECRYKNEEGYEDYPEGEEGWSGEIASIYLFDQPELSKLISTTKHDKNIKGKIDEYLLKVDI